MIELGSRVREIGGGPAQANGVTAEQGRICVVNQAPARASGRLAGDAYSALAGYDPFDLRRAAADLASAGAQLDHDGQSAAHAASLDLIWVAFQIDTSPLGLDQDQWTTS